jgi:5'-nucleotidase / UDP-sugar diphosphatase
MTKKFLQISVIFLIISVALFFDINANRQSSRLYTFSILHFNDVHGGIEPTRATYISPDFPPMTGNMASIKTILDDFDYYIGTDTYILVDAGDFFQGTPIGNLSYGSSIIDIFNMLGVDAVTMGNHEFDFGYDVVKRLSEESNAPFLGANILDAETGEIPPYFKPYIIREVEGVRIGIFGLIADGMERYAIAENIAGLDFMYSSKAAKKYVQILREEEKCDIVIAVTHIGLNNDKRLAKEVAGIDAIIGGHSHQGVRETYFCPVNHTMITQAYHRGGTLGHLALKIDIPTKTVVGNIHELMSLFTDNYPMDEEILDRINSWKNKVEVGFDEVIGVSKINLDRNSPESNMGNLMCDALIERYDADVSFQNSGGIRANLRKGDITVRDIYTVFPFDNDAVILEMTGVELLEAFEASVAGRSNHQIGGARMVFDPTRPVFNRILEVTVGGKHIEDNKMYRVVTNSYLTESEGATSAAFRAATSIHNTYDNLRDVLIQYIQEKGVIRPEEDGRIQIRRSGS